MLDELLQFKFMEPGGPPVVPGRSNAGSRRAASASHYLQQLDTTDGETGMTRTLHGQQKTVHQDPESSFAMSIFAIGIAQTRGPECMA